MVDEEKIRENVKHKKLEIRCMNEKAKSSRAKVVEETNKTLSS